MGLGRRMFNNLKFEIIIPMPVILTVITAAGTVIKAIVDSENNQKNNK